MIGISFIQEAILKVLGDLVSKVVSDGVDISIKGIKDADQNRKSHSQNLQTQIYHIIVDALNELTYNKYRGQNKLYDAAESILKGFISSKDNTDVVKSGLKMLVLQVSDEVCEDFLGILCREICKDENSDWYKEIDMLWKKQESEYFHREFNDLKEAINYIMNRIKHTESYREIHIKNRAEEYAQKWNENVFLNNYSDEDENPGVNIKLRDIYIDECLPHYIWKTNTKPSDKLKNLLKKHIIDNNERKMLLILGQPGIGKSTLITWIMANLVEKKDDIFVYQFASDLKNVNWQEEDILEEIFKAIGLRYDELEGKALILDGFDEIHTSGDREKILDQIFRKLKNRSCLTHFSLVITCRENYVYKFDIIGCDYITLQVWDDEQIQSFCGNYERISRSKVTQNTVSKVLENKNVFGIPLILYMVLALGITIEESGSIVDIYDKIFTLDRSGVYDRCIGIPSFGEEHRISEFKLWIHQISQRIAFWIFENNDDEACITQMEYEKICNDIMNESLEKNESLKRDFLIGNYFKLIKHCEIGTNELQFVHRSIYEYFVVIYFFEAIHKLSSKEEVAGKLGELLKDGHLSKQILEFVKYKFDKMGKCNLPDITKDIFNIMLKDGMTYHIGVSYKYAIERERNIFSNMLKVVGLWSPFLGELDKRIVIYLQCNKKDNLNLIGTNLIEANLIEANLIGANLNGANLSEANLRGAYLSGANLNGAKLSEANLSGAKLSGANLRGAYLSGANLSGANLKGADLIEAYLVEANLSEANLSGANLSGAYLVEANLSGAYLVEANLSGANLSEANLSEAYLIGTIFDESQVRLFCKKYDLNDSRVHISETDGIISYKEYCIRRQKK